MSVPEIRPPRSLDGLLEMTVGYIARYVSFTDPEMYDAAALWAAHTWVVEAFDSTPRIAFLSAEPGSGKSRMLEVLEQMCREPMYSANTTPAVLYRVIDREMHTILLDEADTVWGNKKTADNNEDLRSLINSGHRKGVPVYRIVGQGSKMKEHAFSTYAPVALAGIGDLPDTILTRSIVVRMRRRKDDEPVEAFRRRDAENEAQPIREGFAAWATGEMIDYLADARPQMPPGVTDRPADVWEPLLAIADIARPEWGDRAREAAVFFVHNFEQRPPSMGVRLLSSIRDVFEQRSETLPTVDDSWYLVSSSSLCDELARDETEPWGDLYGKQIDPRYLAGKLADYEIHPKNIRKGQSVVKGYALDDFRDAWDRYLPPRTSATSATSATEAAE